ncbi:uncharacterized protein LOC121875770 [Homarus americanus]|uniref:uncharacterized protein LOC121875770 n=1 Tax=Homarus americanus TaxID=6706 RepID=UPI001C471730|nr:uncharacterized protein LOC121875770 [Homarus americanus]
MIGTKETVVTGTVVLVFFWSGILHLSCRWIISVLLSHWDMFPNTNLAHHVHLLQEATSQIGEIESSLANERRLMSNNLKKLVTLLEDLVGEIDLEQVTDKKLEKYFDFVSEKLSLLDPLMIKARDLNDALNNNLETDLAEVLRRFSAVKQDFFRIFSPKYIEGRNTGDSKYMAGDERVYGDHNRNFLQRNEL